MMGSPRSSATRFTGDAASSIPRPLARAGWVTTNFTLKPAATSFSMVGTANVGVPQKTKSITAVSPFAGLHQLADLALHDVALERADVADVELSVEVVGFMKQGAGQEFFAGDLEGLTLRVLGAGGDFARPGDFLAELRQAQAAFIGGDATFDMDDFRVDQHDLGFRVLLEGDIDDRDALADADLRGCQADAVSGVHAPEHVVDQLAQFVIELGNGDGRLLQDRVTVFDDGIDHLEVSYLLTVAFEIASQFKHRITAELFQSEPRQRQSDHSFGSDSCRRDHANVGALIGSLDGLAAGKIH